MTETPALSVVVPLYNKAAMIGTTLSHALAQSVSAFEMIVVDDGSTDDGPAIVESRNDPRIRLIRQANQGVSATRNRGLAEATTPLVAFLDADDLWAPDHLFHLLELSTRFPQAVLYGNRFLEVDETAERPPAGQPRGRVAYSLLADYFTAYVAGATPFFTSSCMVRRERALAVGGFPPGYSRAEDLTLWATLAADGAVAVSNYTGCGYRRCIGSLTNTLQTEPDICTLTLIRLSAESGRSAQQREAMREYAHRLTLANTLDCLRAGESAAACRFLAMSSGTVQLRRRWWLVRLLAALPQPVRDILFGCRGYRKPAPAVTPGLERAHPVPCPLCGHRAAWPIRFIHDPAVDAWRTEIGETEPYGWWLCRRCGNAYPSTQPDLRVLRRIWAANRITDEQNSAEETAAIWAYRRRVSRVGGERSLRVFAPLAFSKSPGRFLDIACGLGETVRSFAAAGWNAEGIDADPSTQPFHRESGIRSRIGQFETLEIGNDLDIIHIAHAIYFITDPMVFLRKVRRHLAANGLFCVVLADFTTALDPGLPGYAHSFFPTAASMRYALALAGFRTVLCRTISGSIYIAARPEAEVSPPAVHSLLIRWLYSTKALRYTLIGRPNLAVRRMAKRLLKGD